MYLQMKAVRFSAASNPPDDRNPQNPNRQKSKPESVRPDEYQYSEFLDTEYLDPNYRNNANNRNNPNPAASQSNPPGPQNPSKPRTSLPGVPFDSELERLFRMESNPFLNGEMAVWPFSELLDAVENVIPDYVDGKIELAVRYTHGVKGAPKDRTRAEKWYRSAAMQGDARAQYYLGIFLSNEFPRVHPWWKSLFESFTSVTVPTVYEKEAEVWFSLASKQKQRRVAEVDMAQKAYEQATRHFSRRNLAWVAQEIRRIQQEIEESRD